MIHVNSTTSKLDTRQVSLWDLYRFSYSLALRSLSWQRLRSVAQLLLEPFNYWRCVEVPVVLNHLKVQSGERVLDIGSPKLPSLFVWAELGAEVYATDLFPYFIEEYSHFSNCILETRPSTEYHIETQDGRALKYPDEYFDKVYAISVVEHIEDDGDSRTMREISRVLRRGGMCCLTVPFSAHYGEETIEQTLYYKQASTGHPMFYQRHYDLDALQRRLIAPSGLTPSAMEYFGERWVPFERVYSALPRFARLALALSSPVFSRLFLHRVAPTSTSAKTVLLGLRKGD